MLRIILTLFFELSYQQDSKIYCNKDEVFYLGQQLIPFSYQNGTLVENQMQNQEILQLIGRVSIQHLFDNKELVLKQFQQNELQLIFWDDDHYLCKYIVMNLNFENSYLRIHEEIVVDQVTFQLPLCTKFLGMYSIKEQIFILCEQEFFIQLFVLERDKGSSELRIATTSQVDKKQNCQSQIKFEQDLYLAFLNCQDWVIYVVRNGTFEIFIQLEQLNNRVLKSFSIQQDILLQFDYEIYQITTFNEGWFYSNQSRQIQSYFRHHQQHAIFFKGENKFELSNVGFNWILFITCEETPKQVVHLEDKLIINYGDYLQVLETIDNQLILPISVDYLSNELFNYPIIYAFYQNEIMILKKNIPNPTIQCNEFKKADYVFYTYNYLFQRNAVIKSQLVTENQSLQRFYIKSFSRNMTFQFKIYKPFIFIGDYSYKKDVDNQTNFSCQQNLEQLFSCENILDSNIIWSKSKHNKELYILFQNSKKKLIIKNCNKNLETELGQYENFETHNIYEFSNVFLLIFKQQTKVLLIYCQSDYYEQMIVESKDQIINVVYENFFVHLISKTCTQYIIIGKQLFLHQLNQYILLDGECIRAELFKDFLVYVHKGSIIMIKNNITNTITIENAYILNIYRISSMQDCLIIHLKNQDEEYLSKQLLINNRLIKLYDIPKLNFKYSSPMISKIYKFVLILAAYNRSGMVERVLNYYYNLLQSSIGDQIKNNLKILILIILLVYCINSNYQNLLIDIIIKLIVIRSYLS